MSGQEWSAAQMLQRRTAYSLSVSDPQAQAATLPRDLQHLALTTPLRWAAGAARLRLCSGRRRAAPPPFPRAAPSCTLLLQCPPPPPTPPSPTPCRSFFLMPIGVEESISGMLLVAKEAPNAFDATWEMMLGVLSMGLVQHVKNEQVGGPQRRAGLLLLLLLLVVCAGPLLLLACAGLLLLLACAGLLLLLVWAQCVLGALGHCCCWCGPSAGWVRWATAAVAAAGGRWAAAAAAAAAASSACPRCRGAAPPAWQPHSPAPRRRGPPHPARPPAPPAPSPSGHLPVPADADAGQLHGPAVLHGHTAAGHAQVPDQVDQHPHGLQVRRSGLWGGWRCGAVGPCGATITSVATAHLCTHAATATTTTTHHPPPAACPAGWAC